MSPGRALLALNAGSSSLKFALYDVGVALNLTAHGEVENLDSKPHFIARDSKGGVLAETRAATADFAATLDGLLKFIDDHLGDSRLFAVGHRIVYGGAAHIAPEPVTPALLEALKALIPLDPLHLPHNLAPIRALADLTINTSKFNVHDLRDFIREQFRGGKEASKILIYITSFGFRHGLPTDCDLVFDVRFLPNPNYIPKFKKLTGRNPAVARYIRSFPQTGEFIERITDLLTYLLPHYIREGKSYLTISFGCTGGHHRSVMIASEIRKMLAKAGYRAKESHRDVKK